MDYKIDSSGRYYIDRIVAGKRCMLRGKTKAELTKKYNNWIKEKQFEKLENDLGPMFETVAASWLEDAKQHIRYGTLRSYQPRLKTSLDTFSGMRIKDIAPHDITALFTRMAKQSYSKKTIANQKIVLNQIWLHWINSPQWHGDSNPVSLAAMPKGTTSTRREPPTPEQLQLVKQNPVGFGFAAHLIMYTGCRLAEANGLQIKDVDPAKMCFGIQGCITINKAYPWKNNQPYLEQTKTEAGIRYVPIFQPLQQTLMNRIREIKAAHPDCYADCFLLSGDLTPLTKSMYDKRWAAYLGSIGLAHPHTFHYKKKANSSGDLYDLSYLVPDVTAHQFRHELATSCYEAGVPELVAQQILGHKDIATTHKIYTHIRERMLTQSASALNAYFAANTH